MYVCNSCGATFAVPTIKTTYSKEGIKTKKTICQVCSKGDIYEFGTGLISKDRVVEYIFENIVDINTTNRALHTVTKGNTYLDNVINSLSEFISDIVGSFQYPLSVEMGDILDETTAKKTLDEVLDLLEKNKDNNNV